MSYATGGLFEVVMATAADLNSVADVTGAVYAPGTQPVYVRGVAAVIANDIAATGVVKFDKRPTAGSDSGRGDGDVAVLNLTTAHTGGKVVYKLGLNVLIMPGQEVVAEVTDATGASDAARLILLLEPDPEVPANIPAMVLST